MTSFADLGVDPRERWAGLFNDTKMRTAADERWDAVVFLRRQAAACSNPMRIKALQDAAQALENGTHIGAAEVDR